MYKWGPECTIFHEYLEKLILLLWKLCVSSTYRLIICKGYGFLSFIKNMSKNIGQNISKKLND